jgi:hypothetical protein
MFETNADQLETRRIYLNTLCGVYQRVDASKRNTRMIAGKKKLFLF